MEIEFETVVGYIGSNIVYNRRTKFLSILYSAKLHPDCRNGLLEFFPKVESYFLRTGKTNFYNIENLLKCICTHLGCGDCSNKFRCLKTKSRSILVEKFVFDCVSSLSGGGSNSCDMGIIELKSTLPDCTKTIDYSSNYYC
jgi:hypothetical protein